MDHCIAVCTGTFLNRKLHYYQKCCICIIGPPTSLPLFLLISLCLLNEQSVGNGSWVVAGVTTTDVTTSGNQTAIRCSSTHLTSFAVLVDVAGGLAVSAWAILYVL